MTEMIRKVSAELANRGFAVGARILDDAALSLEQNGLIPHQVDGLMIVTREENTYQRRSRIYEMFQQCKEGPYLVSDRLQAIANDPDEYLAHSAQKAISHINTHGQTSVYHLNLPPFVADHLVGGTLTDGYQYGLQIDTIATLEEVMKDPRRRIRLTMIKTGIMGDVRRALKTFKSEKKAWDNRK